MCEVSCARCKSLQHAVDCCRQVHVRASGDDELGVFSLQADRQALHQVLGSLALVQAFADRLLVCHFHEVALRLAVPGTKRCRSEHDKGDLLVKAEIVLVLSVLDVDDVRECVLWILGCGCCLRAHGGGDGDVERCDGDSTTQTPSPDGDVAWSTSALLHQSTFLFPWRKECG